MSNSFLHIQDITFESADVLSNNLGFTGLVNRQYDDRFARAGAKIGTTTNVRLPAQFQFSSGQNIDVQELVDSQMPVTLNKQYQRSFEINSVDLGLKLDDFSNRYLRPALISIANEVDYDGMQLAKSVFGNQVGTLGTAPSSQAALNGLVKDARVKLVMNGAPVGETLNMVGSPDFVGLGSLYNVNVFNPGAAVSAANQSGRISSWGGFDWFESQMVPAHTVGAYSGTPAMNGATVDGATSLVTDGWGAGSTLKAGDTFTVAGVYAVNPQSKVSTGELYQFVVTADSGASTSKSITIGQAIYGPGHQLQNVSALPADNALLTVASAASTAGELNLAFHKNAMVFATADLPVTSPMGGNTSQARATLPELGLSVRTSTFYDPSTDKYICRIDMLGGWAPLYAQLGVKVAA